MKSHLRHLPLLMGSVLLSSCVGPPNAERPPKAPSIAEMIGAIQTAIDPYSKGQNAPDGSGLPPLTQVKLSLQTVLDNKTSGEIDYLLLAVKGYNENSGTQQLDLVLTPQPPLLKLAEVSPAVITRDLGKAIDAAQKEVQHTYTNPVSGNTLNVKQVDVQIGFTVVWDGSAGVNKWVIAPLGISAGEEVSYKTTDTITVEFTRADKPARTIK